MQINGLLLKNVVNSQKVRVKIQKIDKRDLKCYEHNVFDNGLNWIKNGFGDCSFPDGNG